MNANTNRFKYVNNTHSVHPSSNHQLSETFFPSEVSLRLVMRIRRTDHATPLYPQKLALTSPTSGGRSRTKATELLFVVMMVSMVFLFSIQVSSFQFSSCHTQPSNTNAMIWKLGRALYHCDHNIERTRNIGTGNIYLALHVSAL
jgi:hypothetical protein